MFNFIGILLLITMILSGVICVGVIISLFLDRKRYFNKRVYSAEKIFNIFLKVVVLVVLSVFFWESFYLTQLRINAHRYGVSDDYCVKLAKECGLPDADVREFVVITVKSGRTKEEAAAFLLDGGAIDENNNR